MPYRRLGRSNLQVSALCLGTMMFGDQTDAATAGDILRISVTTTGEYGDFTLGDGVVRRGDAVLASGNRTVWIP